MSNHDEQPTTETPDEVGTNDAASAPASLEALTQELEDCRKKAAENWDLFLRTRADADNIRRRATIDVESAHKYSIEKFAREMLAVVDSLDHGLHATSQTEGQGDAEGEGDNGGSKGGKALREGMELTFKLLIDTLDKFGIKQIDPKGQPFDPSFHEALTTQPSGDVEPNTILMVIQKGFTLSDRLLRPARVIVSRALDT